MPRYAGIKVVFTQLDPTASAPTGALYVDSSNANQFTTKPVDGSAATPVATAVNYFLKSVISGGAYGLKVPVAVLPNGKVIAADADTNVVDHIGYSNDASSGTDQAHGVFLFGPNLANAIADMGFTPGDIIYLDKNAGQYINDVSGFSSTDGIVRLGIAVCADGVADGVATDLVLNNVPLALP